MAVVLVLGHGAGGSAVSPFMAAAAEALAAVGVSTVRFNFPYAEAGRRLPDRRPVLLETWGAVAEGVRLRWPGRTVVLGGKSMGGRMAGLYVAQGGAADGVVYLGFPLHGAKGGASERITPMGRIVQPQLYIQGTRDRFGNGAALRPYLAGMARARLVEIPDGDHSFERPRRLGQTLESTLAAVAADIAAWLAEEVGVRRP